MQKLHTKAAKSRPPVCRLAAWALVFVIAVALPVRASIPIQHLGSNYFEIDPGAVTASFSQTAKSLTLAAGFELGDTVGGIFRSFATPITLDLHSFPSLGLQMQLTSGSSFNASFSVELFDDNFQLLNRFSGTTTTLSTNSSVAWLSLADTTVSSLANVGGLQFTWDEGQSGSSSSTTIYSLVGAETEGYFAARSPGGFRFITTAATNNLTPSPDFSGNANGAILPAGATAWQTLSDSNAKTDVTPLDPQEVLKKVSELPVTAWQYKQDPTRSYIGPMAQDFHAAFGLGPDDKHISTLDTDGVALSALKGLIAELRERQERSAAQARRLAELEAELRSLCEELHGSLPPAE
jgi:hypothetical protein